MSNLEKNVECKYAKFIGPCLYIGPFQCNHMLEKSSPIFPKVAQVVANAIFIYLKVTFLKQAQKLVNNWATLQDNLVQAHVKNSQIWSHWSLHRVVLSSNPTHSKNSALYEGLLNFQTPFSLTESLIIKFLLIRYLRQILLTSKKLMTFLQQKYIKRQ